MTDLGSSCQLCLPLSLRLRFVFFLPLFSLKDVTFASPEKQMFALVKDFNFSFLCWLSNFGFHKHFVLCACFFVFFL